MNLHFDESLAARYTSPAQKIRVMSENWLLSNVFCPCCGNEHLNGLRNNLPVADMRCSVCGEIFELKSKRNAVGAKIIDGAYHTMIERITSNVNPQLFIMQYSSTLSVTNLTLIPKFFFTPNIIEKRKPLSAAARRAGWVGCNILYEKIPEQGKLRIIRDGKEFDVANYAPIPKAEDVADGQCQPARLDAGRFELRERNIFGDFHFARRLRLRRPIEQESFGKSQRHGENSSATAILARQRLYRIRRTRRLQKID